MKIAIMGCGAMGSVYAALLASGGNEVLVIDRSTEHVNAINRVGLELNGPRGRLLVHIRAFNQAPDEIVDLVVLAVKSAGVEQAAIKALGLMGPQTRVLTIQNGLGAAEHAASVVGADRLIVGIASGFGAALRGPGQAFHNAMQAMRFGAYANLSFGDIEAVASVWSAAGFDAQSARDIHAMQWEKLICNVAYSAPSALTGMTVGAVMNDPQMGPISRAAATEAWNVALAKGIKVNIIDPIETVRQFGARMPEAKPSALQDIEAGRISEIDFINGAIPREGELVGVTAPVNATLTALVKTMETRRMSA